MWRHLFSDSHRYILVAITAVCLSVGGIILAVVYRWPPADGARGGALAVGLSLVALFLNQPHGKNIYRTLIEDNQRVMTTLHRIIASTGNDSAVGPDEGRVSYDRIDALIKRLDVDARSQDQQNLYMAISAGIGTIVSGFGDMLTAYLQSCF